MPTVTGGSGAPATMDAATAPVIPERECGSCTLCCKVYHVPEIDKVAGKWCTHCKPGKGCAIYDKLPKQCAEVNCLWRTEKTLTPASKPERAKMVLSIFPQNGFMYVQSGMKCKVTRAGRPRVALAGLPG